MYKIFNRFIITYYIYCIYYYKFHLVRLTVQLDALLLLNDLICYSTMDDNYFSNIKKRYWLFVVETHFYVTKAYFQMKFFPFKNRMTISETFYLQKSFTECLVCSCATTAVNV